MSAQHIASPKTSALSGRGGTSWRLWEVVNEALKSPGSAERLSVEPLENLPLSAPGRCLVPDGIHFVCEAVALSARGVKVACEGPADPGDAILANFRGLGEIVGLVESNGDGWFVMDIHASPERLAVLSKRFVWSVRRQFDVAAERRASVRYDQKHRSVALKTLDGREIPGELLDLSATGAAVQLSADAPYFWVGQEVMLDERSGRVRRHFPGGVGVEFDEPREVTSLDAEIPEPARTTPAPALGPV